MKKISILGSTGSIGVNALKVIDYLSEDLEVLYLSAHSNSALLIDQIKRFKPKTVAIVNPDTCNEVKNSVSVKGVEILEGRDGLLELSLRDDVDIMLNGLVGAPGMEPTLNAISNGVDVALSNKESLIMAGAIIKQAMEKSGAKLYPVDSEHSAIWQCMAGENISDIQKLILTGSGGPFRNRPLNTFENISVEEALNHPNWDMGKKITVDSATMMNKGLEVIEAFWLFDFKYTDIEIVIHPQSIIHSMIELKDGSIKAQMGIPDMKIPIQYALTYPRHLYAPWEKLDFFSCGDMTFEEPDINKFPCISLAFESLNKLGTAPAALNLSNDYAVQRFLNKEIKFIDIPKINKMIMNAHYWKEQPNLKDLKYLDAWVYKTVLNFN